MSPITSSWRTTILGLIAGLMLLLPQIGAVVDTDPDTNPDYQAIIAAISIMGFGGLARDGSVSSEQTGIK